VENAVRGNVIRGNVGRGNGIRKTVVRGNVIRGKDVVPFYSALDKSMSKCLQGLFSLNVQG
jgi:hypothetical protein